MIEVWEKIPDTQGAYDASNFGRIRSWIANKASGVFYILRPEINNGRELVCIKMSDGKFHRSFVHRLILKTFVGQPQQGQEVRHIDGNPRNNFLDNLAWGTKSENRLDRIRHGTDHQLNKTHCPQGHPYSPENTYRAARGDRQCRECHRHHENDRQHRLKETHTTRPKGTPA